MSATVLAEQPGRVIYPVLPQAAASRCSYCWQPGPSALCADPYGEGLRRLCGPCDRALRIGRPIELTDAQLAEAWEWLARQHINQRAAEADDRPMEGTGIDAEVIDEAIHYLSPLKLDAGWAVFEGLMDDLLKLQAAEDPDTVLDAAMTGPDHDAETYANHCQGLVDDALHKLIGRTP